MMKKSVKIERILILDVVALGGVFAASAKENAEAPDTLSARDLFVNLPLKNLEILDKSTRLDMLDYYDADSIYQAENGMEGFSELVKVTPDYLEVKITPVTRLSILMLRKTKGPEALLLYTVGGKGQAEDTQLTFLGKDLQDLPRDKYIKYPELDDFFVYPDKESKKMVEDAVPFPTVEFTADPATGNLTAKLTVGEFMDKEMYEKVRKIMKPSLTYFWKGKRYEKEK